MKSSVRFALFTIIFFAPSWAHALIFSIDPASPLIDGNITPDDILAPGPNGPVIVKQGNSLGLQDDFFNGIYDNLDAISKGDDSVPPAKLYFSVDRVAVGLPGSAVYDQAQPGVESAAGDIYKTLPPVGSNILDINEQDLGLTPGFFGDDLDALDWSSNVAAPLYFSIDMLSASNGFGTDCNAANIYRDNIGTIEHSYEEMGLTCGDDLDALVYDAVNNLALFSLSQFSSLTFTYTGLDYIAGAPLHLSPGDVLETDFKKRFWLYASAPSIGLNPDDNVDALEVPEPISILLIGIGLIPILQKTQKPLN